MSDGTAGGPIEARVEEDLADHGLIASDEGDGLYDRYLLALGLLTLSIIAYAFAGTNDVGRLISIGIQGITLLVILRSSRVSRRTLVIAVTLVVISVAGAVLAQVVGDHGGGPVLVGALLAILGPPVIIRRVLAHHTIDITTVAGALCVYLLAGIFFAYVFAAIGEFGDTPFFVQVDVADAVDYVYFSFVTLATLGYGDFTARGDLGRMLSVTEALLGQLYLVSAVALLVANLGRTRTQAAPTRPRPPSRRARRSS